MSVIPTILARVALPAAVAAALLVPAAATADGKSDEPHGKKGKSHLPHGKKDEAPGQKKDKDKGDGPGKSEDAPGQNKGEKGDPPGQAKKDPDPACAPHNDMRPSQGAAGVSSCPGSTTPPVTASAPSITPTAPCTSRRYFRITLGKRRAVRRARVLLNGRPVTVSYGKRKVTARIDLRRRVKGTYVVRTVVVSKRYGIRTGTRRYRVCGG